MIKNRLTQLIYRMIFLTISFIGIIESFGLLNTQDLNTDCLNYYTILSNILCFVVMIPIVINTIKHIRNSELYGNNEVLIKLKFYTTIIILVTFVVYNFILVDNMFQSGWNNIGNLIKHIVCPLLFFFDFILFDKHHQINLYDCILTVILPLIYVAYILIRGEILPSDYNGTIYPYFFLNASEIGYLKVFMWVGILVIAFIFVAFLLYLYDKIEIKDKKISFDIKQKIENNNVNIFVKLYSRIYQTIFKLAIPILPYKDPIIIDDIKDINKALSKDNKPLIVTDKIIIQNNLLDYVTKELDNNNIKYIIYSDVYANPTSDLVSDALKVFKENNCDSFIAIGGGSVIDTAKAVGALYARPNKTLSQLGGILHVRKKIPTLIAIPTTCGTGSETTLASVVIDSNTRHKYAINDFPLIPSYAVLDYKFIKTLPEKLIATTGLDALTHALEAYLGRSTTKETRKYSLDAIKLIFNNLVNACKIKDDASLQNMLVASHQAGKAFSKSYVGYVHAIAHSLGGKYNIAHGYANAVILPYVLKEYGFNIYDKIAKIYDYLSLGDKNITPKEKFICFMNKLDEIENELNISKNIKEIKDEDINEMAKYAIKEAHPLYPTPVMWNKNKIKSLYYKIRG